jgi:hypothetical protein
VEDLPSLSQGRYGHGCGSYQDGDDTVRGGSYRKVKKLSPLIGVMIKFKEYETHFL